MIFFFLDSSHLQDLQVETRKPNAKACEQSVEKILDHLKEVVHHILQAQEQLRQR